MVVDLLSVACLCLSREGTNWADPTINRRIDENLWSRSGTRETVRVCSRHCAHAGDYLALGGSGAYSDARRISARRDWPSRDRALVRRDGRPRLEFVRRVFAPSAVLFRDRIRELLSVVDQTAVANARTLARSEGRGRRPWLQRARQDRHVPCCRYRDHLRYLHCGDDKTSSLHAASFSVAFTAVGSPISGERVLGATI